MEKYEDLKKEIRLTDWYKEAETDKIWWISAIDYVGLFMFSFDKKIIYNFFADWDELTEEQKTIFRKENPELADLKEN